MSLLVCYQIITSFDLAQACTLAGMTSSIPEKPWLPIMASTVYEREISDSCTAGYLFNVQADLPCPDISSAIDRVVIHGRDKSIVELMKTLFRYNLFFVTSSTQPDGAGDAGMKTRHREFIMSRFSHDFHDMKSKKGKGNRVS